MPKIIMKVKNVGSDTGWEEEYDCPSEPYEWAKGLVDNFNATLRHGESMRELVGVEVLSENSKPVRDHKWGKTNLITIVRGSKVYDTMECVHCGITGKRYGVGSVLRDSKYKAKKYEKCNTGDVK